MKADVYETPEESLRRAGIVETLEPANRNRAAPRAKFVLERWRDIKLDPRGEWLVKHFLPRRGLAAIFGKPGAFKSFVAQHIGLCVAAGEPWAGRRVCQAPVVFIAGEGSSGVRKRKVGYVKARPGLKADLPFALIATAPNLGADPGDLPALIAAIEAADMAPGLIVIDTAAQTLVSADENGPGMVTLVANAGELAQHFDALILLVHHTGLSDDKRLRGHTSLAGALDAQILCERKEGENSASLTLQKLKDDVSSVHLLARLERVVVGRDEDTEEISTLIVETVEDANTAATSQTQQSRPAASRRLLAEVIAQAIDEDGETFRPFADGPVVRGVTDDAVRDRYYARIAERAGPDDDPKKLAASRRRSFDRAIKAELDSKRLIAGDRKGRRFLWLP